MSVYVATCSTPRIRLRSRVAVALLLASVLLKPIRELTSAVDDLSQQRFPDPVTVPPGNDGFARLARSFNRMSASIKAAMDRERSFTLYASHELRTPLSAIKLQTESLEMGMTSTEEVVPVLTQHIDRMQRVLGSTPQSGSRLRADR